MLIRIIFVTGSRTFRDGWDNVYDVLSTIAFVVFFFSKGVTREVLYTYLFRVLQRG